MYEKYRPQRELNKIKKSLNELVAWFCKDTGLTKTRPFDGMVRVYLKSGVGFSLTYGDVHQYRSYGMSKAILFSWLIYILDNKRYLPLLDFHEGLRFEDYLSPEIDFKPSEFVNPRLSENTINALIKYDITRMYVYKEDLHIEGVFNYIYKAKSVSTILNGLGMMLYINENPAKHKKRHKQIIRTQMNYSISSNLRGQQPIKHKIIENLDFNLQLDFPTPKNTRRKKGVLYFYTSGAIKVKFWGNSEYIKIYPNNGIND